MVASSGWNDYFWLTSVTSQLTATASAKVDQRNEERTHPKLRSWSVDQTLDICRSSVHSVSLISGQNWCRRSLRRPAFTRTGPGNGPPAAGSTSCGRTPDPPVSFFYMEVPWRSPWLGKEGTNNFWKHGEFSDHWRFLLLSSMSRGGRLKASWILKDHRPDRDFLVIRGVTSAM